MTESSLADRRDFRRLVDHLEETALWVVSEPGEFDYISKGFEDIWGIPPEDVEDDISRLLDTIHPDDRERVRSLIESAEEEVGAASYENRIVRPDGESRWVKTQQIPVRDEAGTFTELVGICTDVTRLKRREEELEALNRVVRHDIRNDMNVILGWGALLEDHVDETGEAYLKKILRTCDSILELTETSRDFVEALTGEEALETTPIPLRSTLETDVDLRAESFPSARFALDPDFPDVAVQANGMLSSVFRNLLNNAVQHNDAEIPEVEIHGERANGTVIVRVADNGPGIPDDQKEAIFGKGEKGMDSPGTGIGLYLVRTLVEQYGGDVWVENREPRGAVFLVRLPMAE